MFHKNLKPKDVLRVVFGDMLDVLKKMRDSQVNFELTPAHSSNVYLIVRPDDPNRVGLGRAEPFILTQYDVNDWTTISLYNLDVEQSESQIPIGVFIGFIHDSISKQKHKDGLDSYVGILVSPTGAEYIGCFCPLDALDNVTYISNEEVKSNFPEMISSYSVIQTIESTH